MLNNRATAHLTLYQLDQAEQLLLRAVEIARWTAPAIDHPCKTRPTAANRI